ncbi:hypothetical protein Pyrde_1946 [Pyrodictium delaneyi]|nr:alkaline phosphatase family protein [Pyrodictium delaneyi]ALL01989.1 hypothetical protein Pyrde_1946 [Pyrodictium delaneyi]
MVETKKVCIIGLDGVGLHNIRLFLNKLPLNNISKIINKGFSSTFSSIPPYTPSAWTSIFTGVNPGKHGIYGFYKVIKNKNKNFTVTLASSYDIKYPRIFEMLTMFNMKSVIINVPLVYPVHGLIGLKNVIVVSDWASPSQFIHPKSYDSKYKEYLVNPPHNWSLATDNKKYAYKVEEFLKTRINMYYDLLEQENYNLFIVVFSELDWLMHRIPEIINGKEISYVSKILSIIDTFIHRAINTCNMVILVSDHGFTTAQTIVSINRILYENKLIAFKYKLNFGKLLNKSTFLAQASSDNENSTISHKFSKIINMAINNTVNMLKKVVPSGILMKIAPIIPISMEIDYSRSSAFMLETGNWGVYVKDEYITMVKSLLKHVKYIKKITYGRNIFWGRYANLAPDLILIPQSDVIFDTRIYAEPVYSKFVGEHDTHALIAFYGDNVVPGNEVNVTMYDIVPTVLSYLGLPLPHDSDGRPLIELINIDDFILKDKFNYSSRFKIMRKIKDVI